MFGHVDDYGGDIDDLTGAGGNISADPQFVDASDDGDWSNDDLHPASGSPLVDAGDPALVDGDGSTSDMGAYGGAYGGW